MVNKIRVKVIITVNNMDTFLSEREVEFDSSVCGQDLSEAAIHIASEIVNDVVKEVVEDSSPGH